MTSIPEQQDSAAEFVRTQCVDSAKLPPPKGVDPFETSENLGRLYRQWCRAKGYPAFSRNVLGACLAQRGFRKGRKARGRGWYLYLVGHAATAWDSTPMARSGMALVPPVGRPLPGDDAQISEEQAAEIAEPDVDVTGDAAPDHLSPRIAKWWLSVVGSYALEEHHRRLLTLAAEQWDLAQAARKELDDYGELTVPCGMGLKAHPSVHIRDKATAAYARLLNQIGLPDPEDQE